MDITKFNFDSIEQETIKHRHENAEEREVKTSSIKPSQITKCIRQQFFDTVMGSDISVPLQKIFDHGNLIHDHYVFSTLDYWVDNVIDDENVVLVNEKRLRHYVGDDDIISGYVDNMLEIQTHNYIWYVPIEVKSINSNGFKLMQPKLDHIAQVVLYMYCYNSDYGVITYHRKIDLESKTFTIYRNKDEYEKLEDKRFAVSLNDSILSLAKSLIKRGTILNDYKRSQKIPFAEMRLPVDHKYYKQFDVSSNVLTNEEVYAKENYKAKCTGYWKKNGVENIDNPRCNYRDECLLQGVDEEV